MRQGRSAPPTLGRQSRTSMALPCADRFRTALDRFDQARFSSATAACDAGARRVLVVIVERFDHLVVWSGE